MTKNRITFLLVGAVTLLIAFFLVKLLIQMETIEGQVSLIQIKSIKESNLDSIKRYGDVDYNLSRNDLELLLENRQKFLILEYDFKFKNLSSWKAIWEVKLIPTFPDEMKNMVFAYRKQKPDGLVFPILIHKNSTMVGSKRIIIRKQEITDDFLELIKKVTFMAEGKIVIFAEDVDFITIGSCSAMLDNPQDIHIEDQTKVKEEK